MADADDYDEYDDDFVEDDEDNQKESTGSSSVSKLPSSTGRPTCIFYFIAVLLTHCFKFNSDLKHAVPMLPQPTRRKS